MVQWPVKAHVYALEDPIYQTIAQALSLSTSPFFNLSIARAAAHQNRPAVFRFRGSPRSWPPP